MTTMKILDLTEAKSEGEGRLVDVKMKRDGGRERGMVYDIDVEFDVDEAGGAEIVERVCPGAETIFRRGQEAKDAARAQSDLHGAAAGSEALAGVHGTTK